MNPELRSTDSVSANLIIVYDGDCPFCSRYVRLLKLREAVGTVQLIDARSDDAAVGQLWRAGYDLNEGMAVKYGGRVYHGADCVHVLALLSTASGPFNRINSLIFRSESLASLLYPVLRLGRNLTLSLLGIRKISGKTMR